MLLIDDLLLAPFSGFNFIMRTLLKVAEEQWTDDAPLKEQLLELQVRLDNGEITEEQYLEAESTMAIRTLSQAASPAKCRKALEHHLRGTQTSSKESSHVFSAAVISSGHPS